MRLLWAHDHKLRFDDGKYFTLGGLSDNVTIRYTEIFGDMNVICRAIPIQEYDNNIFPIENPNVKIHPVKSTSLLLSKSDKKRIEKLVTEADYIMVRLPSFIGDFVVKCAIKADKKYFVEMVTCPWDSLWNHSLKGKIVAPYMYLRTKYGLKHASHTIYVTSEFLQRRYPTKGVSIGCSDVVLKSVEPYVLTKRLNRIKKTGKPMHLTMATLAALDSRYKGQQYVIEALAHLKDNGYKFTYLLAGGGNRTYLQSQIDKYGLQDEVKFVGVIKHEEVFKWLDDIDVYIQPSEQEGLPRAVVEAMSRACPVIGSNAGGIPELIQKECVFNKGNVKKLQNLLFEIYDEERLLNYSQYNFEESKKYQESSLDKKRNEFLYQYLKTK